jgi:SAM-dependent methyltransferase
MQPDEPARLEFAADLYRGTAGYYDRYRLPYPDAMLADLVRRAGVSGQGRLLDLACGTGQLAFPLRERFSQVWAVDQEPDMVQAVSDKATAAGALNVRPVVAGAETLDAEPGYFELVVIGNAFHRLRRDLVAERMLGWLRPGGCVALCWSDGPWRGEDDWQRALAATVDRWRAALGVEDRVPAGWELPQRQRPDREVLSAAGFEWSGREEVITEHRWSLPELAGYVRSTAALPAPVLADQSDAFDADLAASLGPFGAGGVFTQAVSFAYELGRKPLMA